MLLVVVHLGVCLGLVWAVVDMVFACSFRLGCVCCVILTVRCCG